jgi:hypothetical protein
LGPEKWKILRKEDAGGRWRKGQNPRASKPQLAAPTLCPVTEGMRQLSVLEPRGGQVLLDEFDESQNIIQILQIIEAG